MITVPQIRGAKGLLGWDSGELARRADLTRATLSNIENGNVQAREASLMAIAKVFDDAGIEFTDNNGVKFKPKSMEIYEGAARFDEFYDFIYEHLRQSGGNICIYGHNGKNFSKYRSNPEIHRNRMKELLKERPDFSVRTLQEEGDDYMPNAAFSEYRWQKKEFFPPTSYYVFGSCVALISFDSNPPPFVILIKSDQFAEAYRRSFELAWSMATPPVIKSKN